MSRAAKMFTPPPPSAQATAINHEGFPAWSRSLEERFVQTLLTNTLGQTYYSRPSDLLAEAEAVHKEMIAKDPTFAAKAIVYARERGFMRTQPIFALALLSTAPGPHFEQAFARTILTPNDLADFTTIVKSRRKGEGGRRVKRAAGNWLAAKLSEYWAVKYGADKAGGYSLRDLLCVYHPKFKEPSPVVDYLLGREEPSYTAVVGRSQPKLTLLDLLPQVAALACLKSATSDEDKIAAIREGRIPHEQATPFAGSSPKVWAAIAEQMPIFALLKNLATLERHGVFEVKGARDKIGEKLTNADVIAKSKILPFRFIEAEKHVSDARVKDWLRDAVDLAFDGVPDLVGRTAVLLDCSPSMKPPYRSDNMMLTAATFAVVLMKKAKGDGRLVLFDGEAQGLSVSMRDSVLTQAQQAGSWGRVGGTNPSAALDVLLRLREKVDNLVLITDGEQNQGRPFADTVAEYRRQVSPNAKLFSVDVSPQLNAVAPPTDPLTWSVYGWSDQALSFIALASRGWGGVAQSIREAPMTPVA